MRAHNALGLVGRSRGEQHHRASLERDVGQRRDVFAQNFLDAEQLDIKRGAERGGR